MVKGSRALHQNSMTSTGMLLINFVHFFTTQRGGFARTLLCFTIRLKLRDSCTKVIKSYSN